MLRTVALFVTLAACGLGQSVPPSPAVEVLTPAERLKFNQQVKSVTESYQALIREDTRKILNLEKLCGQDPANLSWQAALHGHRAKFHDHALNLHLELASLFGEFSQKLSQHLTQLKENDDPATIEKHRGEMEAHMKTLRQLIQDFEEQLKSVAPGPERDSLSRQLLLNQRELQDFTSRLLPLDGRRQASEDRIARATREVERARQARREQLIEARGHYLRRQDEAQQAAADAARLQDQKDEPNGLNPFGLTRYALPGKP
jgi:hypothetical protein